MAPTYQAVRKADECLLGTDTVALGGFMARLSSTLAPLLEKKARQSVTGRSATTIEFGATPVGVSFWPWSTVSWAFITINEVAICVLMIEPIIFGGASAE